MRRFGYDVELLEDDRPLGHKLKAIYERAEDDFLRIDADVLLTHQPTIPSDAWWMQFKVYDLYHFRPSQGGVQWISKDIIPTLRSHIDEYLHDDRPETRMWRLDVFSNRSLFKNSGQLVGLHGFAQRDWQRVKKVKDGRKQSDYDWWLVERMVEYYR